MSGSIEQPQTWNMVARWTIARIGMGRTGSSLRTRSVLEFGRDHALARDAIHASLGAVSLQESFETEGFRTAVVRSRALNRAEYLRRPDLGRFLHPECVSKIAASHDPVSSRLTVLGADGLSALAADRHALPLLLLLRPHLSQWEIDKVVIATQARVALGDEIGELSRSTAVLVLIGERPGLKAADSLGAYLTYRPRVGRTDAERNCVSNIRPAALGYDQAAFRLFHLLSQAQLLGASGVLLKDESDAAPRLHQGSEAGRNSVGPT